MQLNDNRFRYFKTDDGSPSVFFTNPDGIEEAMHSYSGALSETQYIYGEATKSALDAFSGPLSVLSLGLGLGYNEIMLAAQAAKSGRDFKVYSFESQSALRDGFLGWLRGPLSGNGWHQLYSEILQLTVGHYGVEVDQVFSILQSWQKKGNLLILGDFQRDLSQIDQALNLMLYDAFSKKASPELWQQEQLEKCLQRAAESCVFSTYSSNGQLKRSLRAADFHLLEKKGFAGKRESTLAIKNS